MRGLTVIVLVLLFGCTKKEQPKKDTFTLTVIETNQPKINIDCGGTKIDTVKLKYSFWIFKDFNTVKEEYYNTDLKQYQGLNYSQSYELPNYTGYKLGVNIGGYVNGFRVLGGCDSKHEVKIKVYKNGKLLFERSSNYEIVETFTL